MEQPERKPTPDTDGGDEKMRQVYFSLALADEQRLNKLAARKRVPVSTLVRMIVCADLDIEFGSPGDDDAE